MNTTTQQDELIDAAEERAKLYDGDDREGIKVDVMNAFFAGAAYTQAAANKAAEEGGLSIQAIMQLYDENYDKDFGLLVEPFARAVVRQARLAEVPEGFVVVPVKPTPKMVDATFNHPRLESESHNRRNKRIYAAMISAADRASRQVANKAEVEQEKLIQVKQAIRKVLQHHKLTKVGDGVVEADLAAVLDQFATPPATTGASTVLTDERILEIGSKVSCKVWHGEWFILFARAIEREVAAQAGQVAVPEWISIDDELPPNEELPSGDWPSVIALWKEGALDECLVQEMVTNTAYFCKNIQNFTHWMPLPPSPAKESK